MTTPIPEAAVEAVARVIDHDAWTLTDAKFFEEYDDGMHGVAYCLSNRKARKGTSLIHARAALTAARPLMEAQALREAADAMSKEKGVTFADAMMIIWLNERAATIAERTQR